MTVCHLKYNGSSTEPPLFSESFSLHHNKFYAHCSLLALIVLVWIILSMYFTWFGLFFRNTSFASWRLNHLLSLTDSSQISFGSRLSTYITKTWVLWPFSVFSNSPRYRPNSPFTPPSSRASRMADMEGFSASIGSTLPPGMIHPLPPVTNNTSCSFLDLTQTHAARILKPSASFILACRGFNLPILC